jgi:hypothetical protein
MIEIGVKKMAIERAITKGMKSFWYKLLFEAAAAFLHCANKLYQLNSE